MKKTHKDNIMFKYGNAYINLSVHFLRANNLETEQEQDNLIDKDIKISSYNKPTQLWRKKQNTKVIMSIVRII
jgi:hypothetical protein